MVEGETLTLPVVPRFGEMPSGSFMVDPCFTESGNVSVSLSPDVQGIQTSVTITLSQEQWAIESGSFILQIVVTEK